MVIPLSQSYDVTCLLQNKLNTEQNWLFKKSGLPYTSIQENYLHFQRLLISYNELVRRDQEFSVYVKVKYSIRKDIHIVLVTTEVC